MKILHILPGDDYAACTFEEELGIEQARKLHKEGKPIELEGVEFKIKEFKEVDPEFVKFVKNIEDYDHSKHSTFYVLED